MAYDFKGTEPKIYELWLKSGFFNPDNLPGKRTKAYTIMLPPPNVTGTLHMGHALNATIQDILIRQKRMQGFKTLWLPGTDHAGIATQNVVEKELRKEGLTRFDLGKEKFIERVWEWKEKYGNIILGQLQKMGASCDWSRTRFTMDEGYVKAVETAFTNYYEKGWIYRGKRVVNWCPRCRTSISDLEIDHQEEKGNLWYIKYPFVNKNIKVGGKNYIVVATTRPETMLGDTAVAVSQSDSRYKAVIGEKLILPLVNKEIPIVADHLVDKDFGTGAVKVTPAHDLVDQEIGRKHDLEILKVINEEGKIIDPAPAPYQGLSVKDARLKVIEDLQSQGFLEKIEEHIHEVPHCDRCKATIELLPSLQWFLKMDELAKVALSAVKKKDVKFNPQKWEKGYIDWLKNIKDWCISRQLWWGHRIPLENETDVLDTWFSAALWPFATLGWPEKTIDLKTFYPTNVLVTGRDIINLWVTRMVYSGLEFMKKSPFSDVCINATIMAKDGRRMSKSLGTGVDPLLLIEKYGTDATRFGLIWQASGGQDIRFSEEAMTAGQKFCNKIWNASKFALQRVEEKIKLQKITSNTIGLKPADKKILKTLSKTIESTEKDLEKFQFGNALHTLYDFFWHDFCDKYIEESKKIVRNEKETKLYQQILLTIILDSLKLLHPFIPFVTEEIYQTLPLTNRKEFLMIEDWPKK